MSDNPYEDLLNSNSDVDMSETSASDSASPKVADVSAEENAQTYIESPESAIPQYSIDYTGVNEPADTPTQETAQTPSEQEHSGSYEWYGGKVVENTQPVATTEHEAPPYGAPAAPAPKARKKKRPMPVAVLLILCILMSTVFGTGSAILVDRLQDKEDSTTTSTGGLTINQITPDTDSTASGTSAELSTEDIVERTADSVVEIITESVQTGSFAQQYIESGAGSGVIVDSTGYIITNHHVIENAQKITVTLRSGDSYDATLIGSDSKIDLALLKIEAEGLTSAVFGNSDSLKVGQRTVAIGNPLGQLGGTVTEGIISALDRDVVVDGQTMNLLQTDTAINPGNSGGGLFDAQGSLIGVVVAKSSGSEVEGLGFAIPINDAVDVISDLMEYGYVRGRIAIGMEFIDVTSVQVAWMYGLSDVGCYVYSVDRGTNAEEAGFKSGDLILSVDGTDVSTSDDIEELLDSKAVGEEVVFSIKRGESTGEITLVLEEYVPDSASTFGDSQDYVRWYDYNS